MPRIIFGIVDRLSMDLTGGMLQTAQHPAVAIRFFSDVATHPESNIARHVEDYELVQFGVLQDDLTILPTREVIITGAQWRASQQAQG